MNEVFTWNSGTMSGSGVTNANGGIAFGNSDAFLNQRTLNLPAGQTAALTQANARFFFQASVFNNAGTFFGQNNQGLFNSGGNGTFNNSGIFTRDTSSGTFAINSGITLNNTGTVTVQTGTLRLLGGDPGSTTGDFNISAGATLLLDSNFTFAGSSDLSGAGVINFSGGTQSINGTYSLPGLLITGATLNLNIPLTVSNFSLTSGLLTGTTTLNVSGPFNWSGGTMSGSGITNANGGIVFGNGDTFLTQRTLNLPGGQTAALSQANTRFFFQSASVFNNAGTFLAQNNQGLFNSGGNGTFNNSGTFTRNTGTGTFSINSGIVFNNTGGVNVQTGTLRLLGGDPGSTTGDFNISAGAILQLDSNFNFANSSDLSGAGVINFSSGAQQINGTYTLPDLLLTGSTLTLNIPLAVTNFSLTSGLLTGATTLNVGGALSWSGGSMSGSGITNANGGIVFGNSDTFLSQRTLNLPAGQTAALSQANARFFFQSASVFNNSGTFLAQNNQGLFNNGGNGTFNNTGTFTRNTGTGTFSINSGIVLNNTGTVNVQSGTLRLVGGDTGSTSGDFNISNGATLLLDSNFTFAGSSDLSGAGVIDFSSGTQSINGTYTLPDLLLTGSTLNLNIPLTVTNFSLTSGLLTGTTTLNVSGSFNWSGGTMSSSGITNANGGIVFGNGDTFLLQRTLNLPAGQTAALSQANARFFFQSASVFNNSGTFLAENNQGLFNNGGNGTFNNSGTFTRNTGSGTFSINSGIVLNNTGTVNVQSGTLRLVGGDTGSTSGDFNISAGATLLLDSNFNFAASSDLSGGGVIDFSSGTQSINGTYSLPGLLITGSTLNLNIALTVSNFSLTSGLLTGATTLNVSGPFNWSGGTMSGSGVTNANGGIVFGNGDTFLTQRILNIPAGQTAALSQANARFFFQSAAVFNNSGTFLAENNQGLFNNGGNGTFNNSGTFTRDTGTGTFSINSGIVLNNTGTVNVQSGTLRLLGGDTGSTTGDFNISAGATLLLDSNFNFAGSSDLSGAGVIDFSSGTQSINGTYSLPGLLITGSTLNLNIALTVSNFSLTSGLLTGATTLNVSGPFNWSGGAMSGSGITNANGGIVFGNSDTFLMQRTLNLAAGQSTSLTQANARFFFQSASVFNNAGAFLAQNNQGLFNNGGNGTFNNTGTFTRDTGTGTFTVNNGIAFNNSGTVNANSGTLVFNGGFTQTAGTTQLAGANLNSISTLQMQGGLLTGFGNINAAISNSAMLRPGLGGALNVTGNVSLLSASNLVFQLGGLTQGTQYGFMNVTGNVSLGGQLLVSFVNGFQNSVTGSNSFTVLSSTAALTGVFANIASGSRLETTDSAGSFLVTYSGTTLVLSSYVPGSVQPAVARTGQKVVMNSRTGAANRAVIERDDTIEPGVVRQSSVNRAATKNAGRVVDVKNSTELLNMMENASRAADGTLMVKAVRTRKIGTGLTSRQNGNGSNTARTSHDRAPEVEKTKVPVAGSVSQVPRLER